jgi:beta-galactosidase
MSSIPLNSWRFCRDEDPVLAREFQPEWISDWVAGRGSSQPTVPLFARPDFDDSTWRDVSVPYDFGIEHAFDPSLNHLMGCLRTTGAGWYRCKFQAASRKSHVACRNSQMGEPRFVAAADGTKPVPPVSRVSGEQIRLFENCRTFFDCDGAMSYPLVWINGHFAGGWCYGYTPFRVDLTPWINPDGENVLAVRTYNPPQSSRWYTGAGLYRECRLVAEPADTELSVETQP